MDELASFQLYLIQEQQGKKKKRTLSTVAVHIELFRRLKKYCPSLSVPEITSYLLSLYEKGRKGTYLNAYIDLLHIYGRFKNIDIYETLKYFPEDDFEKATMSDEEIESFLSLPCTTLTRLDTRTNPPKPVTYAIGKKRWEVKTIFWKCIAYTGARPGEIAHLTVDTVDFGRQVFLLDGKTGKRIVPISPALLEELQAYVKNLSTNYLFPSVHNKANGRQRAPVIDDVDWGYDFRQRIKRLGIKRKNLTPYSLRHSFITRLLNEDLNIYKVQNLIGHKQGSPTTSQYYHLTTKALFKTLSKDPLQRHQMPYDKRFEQFRASVRELLSEYCKSHVEESQMLKDLTENFFSTFLFLGTLCGWIMLQDAVKLSRQIL